VFHGQSAELAGEYGRLALDLDQISLAKQLLAAADSPTQPDWRIVSARGTVLAKEGKYDEAITYYERALTLAHDQPSILSNLALAYAMNGEPTRAEGMLRQASAADGNSPRIRQNLALVLGLQGKYDEAKLIASRDLSMDKATDNAAILRQVVKLDPKSVPNSEANINVAEGKAEAQEAVVAAVPVEPVQKLADADVAPEPATDAVQSAKWTTTEAKPELPATKGAAVEPAKAETADAAPAPWSSMLTKAAVAPEAAPKPAPKSKTMSVAEMAAALGQPPEDPPALIQTSGSWGAATTTATEDETLSWAPVAALAQPKR
jgi:tetratricopeptide (TPR) repeat protein